MWPLRLKRLLRISTRTQASIDGDFLGSSGQSAPKSSSPFLQEPRLRVPQRATVQPRWRGGCRWRGGAGGAGGLRPIRRGWPTIYYKRRTWREIGILSMKFAASLTPRIELTSKIAGLGGLAGFGDRVFRHDRHQCWLRDQSIGPPGRIMWGVLRYSPGARLRRGSECSILRFKTAALQRQTRS